jgi:transcriptional regulator with XRE-family HTH domain
MKLFLHDVKKGIIIAYEEVMKIMIWNERIKELREINQLTLKEVAGKLKVSEATAQRYENNIKTIPYEIIEKYAKIFDVSPSYIMGWDDDYVIDDIRIVDFYKKLPSDQQRHLLAYAEFLSKEASKEHALKRHTINRNFDDPID